MRGHRRGVGSDSQGHFTAPNRLHAEPAGHSRRRLSDVSSLATESRSPPRAAGRRDRRFPVREGANMPLSSDLDRATSPGCGSLWPAARSARMSGSRAVAARASMAVVSLVAGACLVTPAEASTVQVQDGTLTITQAPGESTSFVLRAPFHEPSATGPQPPPGTWLVQRDATPGRAGTPPTAGPGCVGTPNPHPEISCSSVARVDIAFGGGADSAFVSAFQDPKVPVRISGGDGDDDLNVAIPPGDVTVDGGPGNDTITTGNARVAGGPGDDAITLGWNPDDYTGPVIDCGPGNDHFENDSTLPASVRTTIDAATSGTQRRSRPAGAGYAAVVPARSHAMSDTNGGRRKRARQWRAGSRRATGAVRATPSPARRRRCARPSPTPSRRSTWRPSRPRWSRRRMEGDVAAAKLVFSYAAGKPAPAPDPDTLDAHELAVRRGNTASAGGREGAVRGVPRLAAVRHRGRGRAAGAGASAGGVRAGRAQAGRVEKRDQKHAPEAPGPTPAARPTGRLGGEAGHPRRRWRSCSRPARPGCPTFTGADRLPHAYADALAPSPDPARRAGKLGRRSASARADHR